MMNYSILMSVYYKENPQYLKEAIESMLNQTVKSDDFVIVCDGPLTEELYQVIDYYESKPMNCIHRLQLDKNYGLGIALNKGLEMCKNELVARMDSDDIAIKCRCEMQLQELINNNFAVIGSNVEEFIYNIENIIGKRNVPCSYEEIIKFSKKRNPFNHPSVMFNKKIIQKVGSYLEDYHLFEDYYLWIRVLKNGYSCKNIQDTLVYMRTSYDMYTRRGGYIYGHEMLKFHKWLKSIYWTNNIDFITGVIPHYIICILPNVLRKKIYMKIRK